MEANVSVVGSENKRCLTSDGILEEGLSLHLESKLNFDATPSNSSLDIRFSAIETPEISSTSVVSAGECDGSIADAIDHTDFHESRRDNDDTDDQLEKCKPLEISETVSIPVVAATDEHNDSTTDAIDHTDLCDSSSDEDDADDKLEKCKSQNLYSNNFVFTLVVHVVFSDMKLKSAKKKSATKHISSRKRWVSSVA